MIVLTISKMHKYNSQQASNVLSYCFMTVSYFWCSRAGPPPPHCKLGGGSNPIDTRGLDGLAPVYNRALLLVGELQLAGSGDRMVMVILKIPPKNAIQILHSNSVFITYSCITVQQESSTLMVITASVLSLLSFCFNDLYLYSVYMPIPKAIHIILITRIYPKIQRSLAPVILISVWNTLKAASVKVLVDHS